jgi:hypothetical protein
VQAYEWSKEATKMARLFVRHKVEDYATWRKAYDDFEAHRTKVGEIGDWVYQLESDPNDVTVIHDFESVEAANALAASTELHQAMSGAGVAGKPDVWITSET